MPNDPGQFDRKVTIQSRSGALTEMGAKPDTWSTIATVWAKRYDRKARQSWEQEGASKVEAYMYTDWIMYYTSETSIVTSECRLQADGQNFEILTVRRVGDDILELTSRLNTDK